MIKAIAFDFDGMVYLTKEKFSDKLIRDFGVAPEAIQEFFKKEFVPCQLGQADLKVEIAKYLDSWHWQGTVDELLIFWFNDGQMNDEIVAEIEKLKARGIKCILATNNEKYRMESLNRQFDLNKLFDTIVVSCDVQVRKPAGEFYDKVSEFTSFLPEEILMFDDEDANVEKAKSLGFQAAVYRDLAGFKSLVETKL